MRGLPVAFAASLGLAALLPGSLAESDTASVYIYPTSRASAGVPRQASSSRPIAVSPAQANRALSHRLNVPGEYFFAPDSGSQGQGSWDWLQGLRQEEDGGRDGQQSGQREDLFRDDDARLVFMIHGNDHPEDFVPSNDHLSSRPTLSISRPPSSDSFDALLHSYGSRLHSLFGFDSHAHAHGGWGWRWAEKLAQGLEAVEAEVGQTIQWIESKVASQKQQQSNSFKPLLDIFDLSPSTASSRFRNELQSLSEFFDSITTHGQGSSASSVSVEQAPQYQALRFQGLGEIEKTYGRNSEQYRAASQALKGMLEATITTFKGTCASSHRKPKVVLIVTPSSSLLRSERDRTRLSKRVESFSRPHSSYEEDLLAPFSTKPKSKQVPASGSIGYDGGACFASASDLTQATGNCSGRGEPEEVRRGGKICWKCKCGVTTANGGKLTTRWSGAACEKQDISADFTLLAGSAIGLLAITIGSVAFLWAAGEQELPSTLTGGAIVSKT